jgi:tetratricopeptide (TPR) repeat protein
VAVNSLLLALMGALAATNPPTIASNLLLNTTGLSVNVPDPNDPVRKELEQVMADDNAAQSEVDDWIVENNRFAASGAGVPREELNQRIRKRFERVRLGYEGFLKRHPDNVEALVAYSSFLNDLGELEEATSQLERARQLSPKDPVIWNNLGVYYSDGHHGPPVRAFPCFEKAVELKPLEPLYYQNFAESVYVFRKDAREYFHLDESGVFDKALGLYHQALKLDPTNFALATDLAAAYYEIKPIPVQDALVAWTNALRLAGSDFEREGIYIHMARIKMYYGGRLAEARAHLNAVTNAGYAPLKQRLVRNLEERENPSPDTNAPPALPAPKK